MSSATEESIQVCEALPPEERSEVLDFARSSPAQLDGEKWGRIITDPTPLPRLAAFLHESAKEPDATPDVDRL